MIKTIKGLEKALNKAGIEFEITLVSKTLNYVTPNTRSHTFRIFDVPYLISGNKKFPLKRMSRKGLYLYNLDRVFNLLTDSKGE